MSTNMKTIFIAELQWIFPIHTISFWIAPLAIRCRCWGPNMAQNHCIRGGFHECPKYFASSCCVCDGPEFYFDTAGYQNTGTPLLFAGRHVSCSSVVTPLNNLFQPPICCQLGPLCLSILFDQILRIFWQILSHLWAFSLYHLTRKVIGANYHTVLP